MWSMLTGKGHTSLHHQMCEGGLPWGLAVTVRGDHLVFWCKMWGNFHLHKYTVGMGILSNCFLCLKSRFMTWYPSWCFFAQYLLCFSDLLNQKITHTPTTEQSDSHYLKKTSSCLKNPWKCFGAAPNSYVCYRWTCQLFSWWWINHFIYVMLENSCFVFCCQTNRAKPKYIHLTRAATNYFHCWFI